MIYRHALKPLYLSFSHINMADPKMAILQTYIKQHYNTIIHREVNNSKVDYTWGWELCTFLKNFLLLTSQKVISNDTIGHIDTIVNWETPPKLGLSQFNIKEDWLLTFLGDIIYQGEFRGSLESVLI